MIHFTDMRPNKLLTVWFSGQKPSTEPSTKSSTISVPTGSLQLQELFGDLHRIESSPLEQLVAAYPKGQAVL